MESEQTTTIPDDVINEFKKELDCYAPPFQRKALAVLKKMLPGLEAEYEEKQISQTTNIEKIINGLRDSHAYKGHLRSMVKELAEKLTYHKPIFQQAIITTLESQLPELEKTCEEEQARTSLIDDLLNEIVQPLSTAQLVLLVKELRDRVW